MTFLLVTHDQDEAMTMAHRIGVMERGKLLQIGSPRELYEHPAHRSVAAFLGEASFFEGRIAGLEPGCAIVEIPAEKQRLIVRSSETDSTIGTKLWLAVRPEKMTLAAAAAADSDVEGSAPAVKKSQSVRDRPDIVRNRLDGVLVDIAYLGDQSVYHVRLPSGALAKASRPNAARGAPGDPAIGAAVGLAFPPEAVMVFPA